ncbi:MAG: hypothetical protein CMI70_03970 [Candidatus Pelagibacter sp.]|jgi:hypothetical protein|nr:hypothetical protein [Candidatus Pelagibacter sp.]|tara:strand:- start:7327 stop:8373 length:1047 start_codon:yes stop_codon:yes gene_type:complete
MKILFIGNSNVNQDSEQNDYMNDIVLHGLREIYGNSVIDYPGVWHMYRDEVKKRNYDISNLWGKGFTLYNLLSNYQQIDRTDIKNKIKTNYFDFIIFGSIDFEKSMNNITNNPQLFFDKVINSKSKIIIVDGSDSPFVNEKLIKMMGKGVYFKRELISDNIKNVYPISFAIPKEKIVHTINPKPLNILAPLIPGKYSTYIYENEQDYYQSYQNSVFALTYKKMGWDSLMHYEILMNGCIPLFLNIDKCPEKTLTNLPKKLLSEVFIQYSWILNQFFPTNIYKMKFLSTEKFFLYFLNLFKKKYDSTALINNYPELFEIKRKMIDYTKKNLTTEKIASNVISDTIRLYE